MLFRPIFSFILDGSYAYLMTAGGCDDHRFSFFFCAVLRASLGGRQVYWPRAMSIGDDLYYSGFCVGRQVRHEMLQ